MKTRNMDLYVFISNLIKLVLFTFIIILFVSNTIDEEFKIGYCLLILLFSFGLIKTFLSVIEHKYVLRKIGKEILKDTKKRTKITAHVTNIEKRFFNFMSKEPGSTPNKITYAVISSWKDKETKKEYKFRSILYEYKPNVEVGDKVEIYIDKNNPRIYYMNDKGITDFEEKETSKDYVYYRKNFTAKTYYELSSIELEDKYLTCHDNVRNKDIKIDVTKITSVNRALHEDKVTQLHFETSSKQFEIKDKSLVSKADKLLNKNIIKNCKIQNINI